MAVPCIYIMHSYLHPTLPTSLPPLYKLLPQILTFYFATHRVWPGPLLWTWVWDYPMETSELLSGYTTESIDSQYSMGRTRTPLPHPSKSDSWQASLAEIQAASVSSWAQWLSYPEGGTWQVLSLCSGSSVIWCIIYFVCHRILTSLLFFLMSTFTILACFHLQVLVCQLHREISIWW